MLEPNYMYMYIHACRYVYAKGNIHVDLYKWEHIELVCKLLLVKFSSEIDHTHVPYAQMFVNGQSYNCSVSATILYVYTLVIHAVYNVC